MNIDSIIEHYVRVLSPERIPGANSFILENLFKTDKFRKMLDRKIPNLYLIYVDEYDESIYKDFFDNEHFIYAAENYGPPIWDFNYACILVDSKESLNLFKVSFNMKEKVVINLSPILRKIYREMKNNNV